MAELPECSPSYEESCLLCSYDDQTEHRDDGVWRPASDLSGGPAGADRGGARQCGHGAQVPEARGEDPAAAARCGHQWVPSESSAPAPDLSRHARAPQQGTVARRGAERPHLSRVSLTSDLPLLQELELYRADLLEKPALLVLNKMDTAGAQDKYQNVRHQVANLQGNSSNNTHLCNSTKERTTADECSSNKIFFYAV